MGFEGIWTSETIHDPFLVSTLIAEHTELFVSFGGLRISNAQVTFGGSGPHHTRGWLERCSNTDFVSIDGGNHAQFGDYGPQRGDGEATISLQMQLED